MGTVGAHMPVLRKENRMTTDPVHYARFVSTVFDLYGEYIRYDGGEAPMRVLTSLLDSCGVGADATK